MEKQRTSKRNSYGTTPPPLPSSPVIRFERDDCSRSSSHSVRILTRDVQGLGVLAFSNVVVNLAFHDRVVKIASRVVDDHFRGVVADHLLLVDEPPNE